VAALRWGFASAWACRRALLVVLFANLALAAAVLYPLYGVLDASLSPHPEAARMGRELDFRWWTDLTTGQPGLFKESVDLLGIAAFATVIAGTFFAGGLLQALQHGPHPRLTFEPLPGPVYRGATPDWRAAAPGPASVQLFLRESARHFPRFLALLLLSLPAYWIVQIVFNRWAVLALDRVLESVEDERIGLLLTVTRASLFVAAFYAVTVVFEYARAQAVLRPGASLGELFALPARLVRRRPATLIGIEAGAILLQGAAMLAFIPLDRLLGAWPPAAATAGLAASQVFLFTRLLVRAGTQGAQIRVLQGAR